MNVREPAVAGSFYPADGGDLNKLLDACWQGRKSLAVPPPKALIAPHAGYVYSGPIAATAYATLEPLRGKVTRVVLLGPSHRYPLHGFAVPEADAWHTPLGDVPLHRGVLDLLAQRPDVVRSDRIHAPEHSLEVHVPFLQRALGTFDLVPVLVGGISPQQGADLLDAVWGGAETLVVISSDLSHYHDLATARRLDAATSHVIEAQDAAAVQEAEACGAMPVSALLAVARRRGLKVQTVDLRTSADTAGRPEQVVGYGAWLFWPGEAAKDLPKPGTERFDAAQRQQLCEIAMASIQAGLRGQKARLSVPADAWLHEPAGVFVTLKTGGQLRGCIGSLEANRALADSVAHHAHAAAFQDPRFEPLRLEECADLDLSISVLSPNQALPVASRAELLSKLRRDVDGLIVRAGWQSATFLPAVWENLRNPEDFIDALWRKAGLQRGAWPAGIQLATYTTESWSAARAASDR